MCEDNKVVLASIKKYNVQTKTLKLSPTNAKFI